MHFYRIAGAVQFSPESDRFRIRNLPDSLAPFLGQRVRARVTLLAFQQLDPYLRQMSSRAAGCAPAEVSPDGYQAVL